MFNFNFKFNFKLSFIKDCRFWKSFLLFSGEKYQISGKILMNSKFETSRMKRLYGDHFKITLPAPYRKIQNWTFYEILPCILWGTIFVFLVAFLILPKINLLLLLEQVPWLQTRKQRHHKILLWKLLGLPGGGGGGKGYFIPGNSNKKYLKWIYSTELR